MVGIDATERKISFIAGGLAIVLAALFLPHLLRNSTVTDTLKPKHNQCLVGYHLVKGACSRTHVAHPSAYFLQFGLILAFGIAMVVFAQRSRRSGVAMSALFLGLALGTVGLPFLFLGGWLIIRALRLQKYGDASFAGSNRRAREKAQAKRAGRSTASSTGRTSSRGSKTGLKPSGPAQNKRYTPKQKPRKR